MPTFPYKMRNSASKITQMFPQLYVTFKPEFLNAKYQTFSEKSVMPTPLFYSQRGHEIFMHKVSYGCNVVEWKWNLVAHGKAREKWRGKRRMEWVASSLALYWNTVYPALLPLMRTPRLPAADWTDTPANINGLVHFAGRPNLVSARVPSHSIFTLQCF